MSKRFILTGVVVVILVVVAFIAILPGLSTPTPTVPTIPATVALQKLISIPAACVFAGDGSVIEDDAGHLYDIKTGQVRFTIKTYNHLVVSPNLAYATDYTGGVYDVKTGLQLFTTKPANTGFAAGTQFSPDSTIVVIKGAGVYEVSSGKQIMPLTAGQAELGISPDGQSLAVTGYGVYDLHTGQQRFAIGGTTQPYIPNQRFSKDSKYLTVNADGVYEVTTGRKVVSTDGGFFTPDEKIIVGREGIFHVDTGKPIITYLAIIEPFLSDDGKRTLVLTYNKANPEQTVTDIYDVETGKTIREMPEGAEALSNDGRLFAIDGDGVYDVDTGTKRLSVPPKAQVTFSSDSSLVAIEGDGIYEAKTGKRISQIPSLHNKNVPAYLDKDQVQQTFSLDNRLIMDSNAVYEVSTGAKLADGTIKFLKDGSLARQTRSDAGKFECTISDVIPVASATAASTP